MVKTDMRTAFKNVRLALAATVLAVAVALVPAVAQADDDTVDFDLTGTIPAADYQSTLRVEKVDSRDGAAITDPATFAIFDAKDMNTPLVTFDTVNGVSEFKRWLVQDETALNIDTEYVLVETKAPAGYEKAADTHFKLETKAVDATSKRFATEITILSGDNAELVGADGIRIKDDRTEEWDTVYKETHRTQTVDREVTKPSTKKNGKGRLSQTSDDTPVAIMVGVAAAGVAAIAVSLCVRRRRNDK